MPDVDLRLTALENKLWGINRDIWTGEERKKNLLLLQTNVERLDEKIRNYNRQRASKLEQLRLDWMEYGVDNRNRACALYFDGMTALLNGEEALKAKLCMEDNEEQVRRALQSTESRLEGLYQDRNWVSWEIREHKLSLASKGETPL